MTKQELKDLKFKLKITETAIADLLKRFESETGFTTREIKINTSSHKTNYYKTESIEITCFKNFDGFNCYIND